ncbi:MULTISPECIES: hypothetical protein [Clostridia]|uniref:hypothetical protein n=1 Tax=Clostridia TaxID=186801 RepID=UPI0029051611|nr:MULTISPECIES: hypothetical protein [Clostridia]MDU0963626.1 hypothetical protein [Peptostreptococcus anaerobius]MDU0997514.1 hypothetical protein [Peptostreptococcus anaerobius]MDU1175709.1 hypothetical protein [Peptostreptococcus anaerobius]MDU1232169.1 hypothetical protein [Clostridium sp.]MDU1233626.1 hypothetical protein [Peptostreptococcus anaerobius]
MDKPKKKMGRPTDNPKTEKIGIRISKKDLDMLEECAKISGETRANVIVMGIKMFHEKITK